jgi:phosphoribosylanthranilate isomerase
MIQVKVCGITRVEDAFLAAEAGADLVGFIFAASPRQIAAAAARTISERLGDRFHHLGRVGVFVNPTAAELSRTAEAALLTHIQVYGALPAEPPQGLRVICALPVARQEDLAVPAREPWAVLVEPKIPGRTGGTGQRFPWAWLSPFVSKVRLFVAGGLDAESVVDLLSTITPFGVDASSGLERAPGVKDPAKVRAFVQAVRGFAPRKGVGR